MENRRRVYPADFCRVMDGAVGLDPEFTVQERAEHYRTRALFDAIVLVQADRHVAGVLDLLLATNRVRQTRPFRLMDHIWFEEKE